MSREVSTPRELKKKTLFYKTLLEKMMKKFVVGFPKDPLEGFQEEGSLEEFVR